MYPWLSCYLLLTISWGLNRQIQAFLFLQVPLPLQNSKPHGIAIIIRSSIISKLGRTSMIRVCQIRFLIFMGTKNLENSFFFLSQTQISNHSKNSSWQKKVVPLYFVFTCYLKCAKLHNSKENNKMYVSPRFRNYQHFWCCLICNSPFSNELF